MVARREAEMRQLAKTVGGETQVCVVDLSRIEESLDWIATAEERFGPIDVLIHNAGVQLVEPAEEHDPEEMAREAVRLAAHKLPVKTKFVRRFEMEVTR